MIGAGTFTDLITISHGVTLYGKGIDETTIQNILIDEGVTGLTLDGLTIVHGSATAGQANIFVNPTLYYEFVYDVTINNCKFTG